MPAPSAKRGSAKMNKRPLLGSRHSQLNVQLWVTTDGRLNITVNGTDGDAYFFVFDRRFGSHCTPVDVRSSMNDVGSSNG